MISESKVALLEAVCGNPGESEVLAASVRWERQMEILYCEAQHFHGWWDARYDPRNGHAADGAIAARVLSGRWPKVTPAVARLLYARLTQAVVVITANQLVDPLGGTTMPVGLPDDRLQGALIAFWTYEMDLPLPEHVGRQHGTA
jgi:hypothetical protein